MKEVTTPDGGVRAKPEFRDLLEISRSRGVPMGELRSEVERVIVERKNGREEQ
jgi:uncharacterized protein (DUF111 family)